MEKNQYKLCIEILRRLDSAKVLKDIIIIGSWCIPFYKQYFAKVKYLPSIKTRDIDLLVPVPSRIQAKIDIPELLKDIGFVIGFRGMAGYIKLEHPELIIEFLVPEKGKGIDKPYPLPQLGVNAQTLRFLNFLTSNTISVKLEGVSITVPHPANFSLHKLIVFQRRQDPEKIMKDKDAAMKILKALIDNGEADIVNRVFNSAPKKWQQRILKGLREVDEIGISSILQ